MVIGWQYCKVLNSHPLLQVQPALISKTNQGILFSDRKAYCFQITHVACQIQQQVLQCDKAAKVRGHALGRQPQLRQHLRDESRLDSDCINV